MLGGAARRATLVVAPALCKRVPSKCDPNRRVQHPFPHEGRILCWLILYRRMHDLSVHFGRIIDSLLPGRPERNNHLHCTKGNHWQGRPYPRDARHRVGTSSFVCNSGLNENTLEHARVLGAPVHHPSSAHYTKSQKDWRDGP